MKSVHKQQLSESRLFLFIKAFSKWMDRYCIDGIAGLIPGGIGDVITSFFSMVFVYISVFKLRSLPLTLALLSNILRDVCLGLLPFRIGDVIDFFNKSNLRNLQLVEGYMNDDKMVIMQVRRKAVISALLIVLFIASIVGLFMLLAWLASTIGSRFSV